MTKEHPFAQYIRILGKGPTLSRPLTREETRTATAMVLAGEVEPVQLGAFLCLLRVKTETPDEMAGFVEAARATIAVPAGAPAVDLDWSSYAGKTRRLPWYLLSALLLAGSGVRVFMHGADGHTAGRIYLRDALAALGIAPAASTDDAAERLAADNFAYLPLEKLCPPLHRLMGLRDLLGLRSPVHSAARMLNPFRAPHEVIGVAHPHYRPVHQQAARMIGQRRLAVFKGEGGEAERRPEKPALVFVLDGDSTAEEEWPALPAAAPAEESLDLARLRGVWDGTVDDAYAVAAIASSAAVPLKLMGRADSFEAALALANQLWERRDRSRLPGERLAGVA